MTASQFARKVTIKAIVFIFLLGLFAFLHHATPVITNEMAMTQMENSNEMYLLMEYYQRVKAYIKLATTCTIIWFTSTIACDTYKFHKNEKEKN